MRHAALRARVARIEAAHAPPRAWPVAWIVLAPEECPPEPVGARGKAKGRCGSVYVAREPDEPLDAFKLRCLDVMEGMCSMAYPEDFVTRDIDVPAIPAPQPKPAPVDPNALAGIGRTDPRYAGVWDNWQLPRTN